MKERNGSHQTGLREGRRQGETEGKEKTRRVGKGGCLCLDVISRQSCFQGVNFSFDYFPLSVSQAHFRVAGGRGWHDDPSELRGTDHI